MQKRYSELYQFTSSENRSERSLQTDVLAPVLRDPSLRWRVLRRISGMDRSESDSAVALHYVWVLRDIFFAEREKCRETGNWQQLVNRWVEILDLPNWATDLRLWLHPKSETKSQKFVVHPTQKAVGWTHDGLVARGVENYLAKPLKDIEKVLFPARKVLNTECDCFVQTEQRLIVIECKGETNFSTEQRERQKLLIQSLDRVFQRPKGVEYIEIDHPGNGDDCISIAWHELRVILGDA